MSIQVSADVELTPKQWKVTDFAYGLPSHVKSNIRYGNRYKI